jgi:hypothetical protein
VALKTVLKNNIGYPIFASIDNLRVARQSSKKALKKINLLA